MQVNFGVHKFTISRELKRCQNGYSAALAQEQYDHRAKQKGRKSCLTPKLKKKIEKGLKASWSPEQICGRYQLEQKPMVAFKTIYNWLYAGLIDPDLSVLRRKGKSRQPKETRGTFRIGTSFQEYHSFLWSKVKLKDNPFRKEITQGLLLALFYEIYNIYQGHVVQERIPKSRKEDLFERFIRAVSESYKEERSVSYYADKMFLTAKHLSTVVKEISGKTAGEWIDSLVVLEAKALLKSSEMSIQEIADELHFANQSFFGKYFKHHTGMSPKEYRRQ